MESRGRIEQNYSKKRIGEGDVSLDKDRLAEALIEEKKRKARGGDDEDRFSKKKKGLKVGGHDVTEEELGESRWCVPCHVLIVAHATEAYRMNRRNMEDPMANYVDTEGS